MLKVLLYWTILCSGIASAQMFDDDVENLAAKNVDKGHVHLTWDSVPTVPCMYSFTYSVFRSKEANFAPGESNRILEGVKSNSVTVADRDSQTLYHVRAVAHDLHCQTKAEPGFHGTITLHPLATDEGGLLASLRVKWRPGTAQRGALSYIVSASYTGAGDAAAYYLRARRCSYFLDLVDLQRFKVEAIPISFVQLMTGDKITALDANNLAYISPASYADFNKGGDWTLEWTCPGK